MKSSYFVRNRKKIAFSGIGILFIMLVAYLASVSYFRSLNASIGERRSIIETLPLLRQRIALAGDILNRYKSDAPAAEVLEMLNARLNQVARDNSFTLDSLSVEIEKQSPKETQDNISIFKVAVKGEGSLTSIIGFFNEVSSLHKLFTVKAADLRSTALEPEHAYKADFVFAYYCLP